MERIKSIVIILLVFVLSQSACKKTPTITDNMLDSKVIYDPSVNAPADFLLSYKKPNPTPTEAAMPVFITCHGYSASTYEWLEFKEWSDTTQYFVSSVLLGGHGTTYEDFKNSTWKDWQKSIITEYERLVNAGYTNINFVGSSTSCALLTEMLATGYFNNKTIPNNILLVDPIVIPSSKTLSLIGVVGPMLGYVEAENIGDEVKYWYNFRPHETLRELNHLVLKIRKHLEDGIQLPKGCNLKVYKSVKDETGDPVSAVLMHKGFSTSNGGKIDIEMVNSNLHVYTRLGQRPSLTQADYNNQLNTFNDFVNRAVK